MALVSFILNFTKAMLNVLDSLLEPFFSSRSFRPRGIDRDRIVSGGRAPQMCLHPQAPMEGGASYKGRRMMGVPLGGVWISGSGSEIVDHGERERPTDLAPSNTIAAPLHVGTTA